MGSTAANPMRQDRPRTGAAGHPELSVAADAPDLERLIGPKRQRVVVLEQHDPLPRGLQGDLVVRRQVDLGLAVPGVKSDRVIERRMRRAISDRRALGNSPSVYALRSGSVNGWDPHRMVSSWTPDSWSRPASANSQLGVAPQSDITQPR
jgi:hypothetical protein